MVHFYSYAEFHADPLPRPVRDVRDYGSIIADGLCDPCSRAITRATVVEWLAITQTAKRRIGSRCTAFK